MDGFYQGCVFPTGNVIVDDTLYVYYGGADRFCCVATCSVEELLEHLRKNVELCFLSSIHSEFDICRTSQEKCLRIRQSEFLTSASFSHSPLKLCSLAH